MDKLVYTALSGLRGHMSAQAAIANNIANASTTGYRSDKVQFDSFVLKGEGLETRAPSGERVIDADRQDGAIISTGRSLDVAVSGDTWLSVQAANGDEAYTRRGDFQMTDSGLLTTGDGFPVLGSGGPITLPPNQGVSIAPDGSVNIIPIGGRADQPQTVDRLKLVSAKGTETVKGLDNLLRVKGGGALPEDMDAKVRSGSLEQSNVNLTEALVDMIENQRSYEVQANLLQSAKSMDEGGASLLRLPG